MAMDELEISKIFGAGCAALLAFVGFGQLGSAVVGVKQLDEPAYVIEIPEAESDGGEVEMAEAMPIGQLMAMADIDHGAKVFKKCSSCHKIADGGAHGVGPDLYGIVGRDIAGADGYSYSDALMAKEGPWDFAALDGFLEAPKTWAKGTKMGFKGLSKPEDRASVIAWMNEQGDSPLPMPALEAEEPMPAPEAEEAAVEETAETEIAAVETEAPAEEAPAAVEVEEVEEKAEAEAPAQVAEAVEEVEPAEEVQEAATETTETAETVKSDEAELAEAARSEEVEVVEAPEEIVVVEADAPEPAETVEAAEPEEVEIAEAPKETVVAQAPAAVAAAAAFMVGADIEKGAKVFRKCKACHKVEADAGNAVGPNLHGVVGREIAALEGFKYSKALMEKDGVWDFETLNAFLLKPKEWAKGTRMSFAGLRKDEDRAGVIAWLNEQSDAPLPLPE